MMSFRMAGWSLVSLVLVAGSILSVSPAAAGETKIDFVVRPASGSEVSVGGDYFRVRSEPGGTSRQTLELKNESRAPVALHLAAVDAWTAQMGGVDYGEERHRLERTGGWITLGQRSIELAPGSSTSIPFTVDVPEGARSGIHLAGIAVWSPKAETAPEAVAAATIELKTRRVVAVEVELPGRSGPELVIRGAAAAARSDGLYLEMDLFNEGRGYARGEGLVRIQGQDGPATFPLDIVVPETGTAYPIKWSDERIPLGAYRVSIEVDYSDDVARWEGDVVVGQAVDDDLIDRGFAAAPGTFPWPVLLTAVGLVLLLLLVFFIRRRRGHADPRSGALDPARG